jgi:CDP-diacylglycerol--serine O-phosphatidyltransferase
MCLILSLYAIVLALEGRVQTASLMIMLAWCFDGIDGMVARITRSQNKFGAEFDNLVDLFIYTVSPAFVLYAGFLDYSRMLAILPCFYVIAVGCIRLARANSQSLSFPGYWLGFPRPGTGLFIIFLINSRLFSHFKYPIFAAIIIFFIGLLSLTYLPYINNKAQYTPINKVLIIMGALTPFVLFPFGYFWDACLFWIAAYIFTPWYAVSRQNREKVRMYVKDRSQSEKW